MPDGPSVVVRRVNRKEGDGGGSWGLFPSPSAAVVAGAAGSEVASRLTIYFRLWRARDIQSYTQ
jgi:hypothetical protein